MPRPVRSLSVLRSAFPTPWCLSPPQGLAPPALLGGCAGHAEAGREPGSLCLPLAPAEAGTLGSLRVVPVRGPAMGLALAGPSGVGLGLRALRWLACVDPVTDASGFPYRPSFNGGLGRCTGAVSCGRRHLPLRVRGRHARVPCVCACARPSWPGRAGQPPGLVFVRLTFSFGRYVFLLCLALSGLGLPWSWFFVCPPSPLFLGFFFSPFHRCFFFPCAPFVSCFLWFPAPGALGLGALCCSALRALSLSLCCPAVGRPPVVAPLPPFLAVVAVPRCLALVFFFPLFCAPLFPAFCVFRPRVPWALGLVCVCCARFSGSSCALAFFVALGWPLVPAPPPPFCVSRFSLFSLGAWVFFSPLLCAPVVSGFLWFPAPGTLGLGAVFCLFFSASRCPALRARSPRLCLPLGRRLLLCGCCPPPPPSLLCLAVFVAPARCLGFLFFFSSSVRPRCLRLSLVSGPGCLGPRCCALFASLAFRFSALRALSPLSCFPPGRWLLPGGCCPPPPPPAPLCVSRFSSLPLGAVCRVLCCAVCPWVRCCAGLLRVVPPGVVLPCVVLLCCARLVPLLVAPCPLALPVALGPCALRRCVLRCSPVLCALCCVCFVVAWWCVLLFAALLFAVCVPGCCAVCSLSSPLCAVLCFAVLVRLRCAVRVVRAVAGAWCCGALLCVLCVVLFPLVCCGALLGLVARGCLLVACCGVGVPVCPRGLLPCGWCDVVPCPASLCRVLWCCAVAWCCAVVFCCRVAVLLGLVLPSCGLSCCAVLCCWLAVLFFARWWCLRAVVLFPSCCAFPVFSALCAAVPCCAGCGALLPCVVRCGAVLSRGAVLSCSAVVLRCCLCLLCPPVACRAAPCCAVLCFWLSVLFFARWWRLCAVVPFPSLPARTKNINYLTCHPALVAVSWLACLGGCGVLDLAPRTFHLQRKGGESVEGGARAGGEGTW